MSLPKNEDTAAVNGFKFKCNRDFRRKRCFEAKHRAKLPGLGCEIPPEGFGGRDNTDPTPPTPSVRSFSLLREVAPAQVAPSRILTSPRAGAPVPQLGTHPWHQLLKPGTQHSSRTCSRHSKTTESKPGPVPSPHLGTAYTFSMGSSFHWGPTHTGCSFNCYT